MSRTLLRLGGLVVVGDILYLATWELFLGGADDALFRTVLVIGGLLLAGGIVIGFAARARSGLAGTTCVRCGRRIARGAVYCRDHQAEQINRYRDEERRRGG
jgi:hypothetical protein